MSIYNRTYVCRLAPCTTTPESAIRRGLDVPDESEWPIVTESFERGAFTGTDPSSVPVLWRHDVNRVVGRLTGLSRSGGWHVASFELDHSRSGSVIALDTLRVGTPVSVGFDRLRENPMLAELGVRQHTLVRLNEVSVLGRGDRPAFPGAEVVSVIDLPRRARAAEHAATTGYGTTQPHSAGGHRSSSATRLARFSGCGDGCSRVPARGPRPSSRCSTAGRWCSR